MISGLPLLETKLYVPQWLTDLVSRPRLLARIQQVRAFTLVSAPAGFGKTTLLAEWIASLPTRRIAWVSLDPSDNDAAFFWTYLIAALQKVEAQLGQRSLSLLHSPHPPPIESVLVTLINEINAVEEPFALVLDDYHVIETPSIHRAIDFLLSHRPPQMHLVVASRSDPPWPLARMRARGHLTELRASDLRFTSEEATAFLNQVMGLDISVSDVTALEQRTEGWIAGLQLAALSMQGRDNLSVFIQAFSGNDRYIVDYLLEEVLQRQSDSVRHFLLQTAILERLSAPLCSAVCDIVDDPTESQSMLVNLERGNLFIIPLDNKRQWYRYHHLFADVLQAHARAEQPEKLLAQHGRASQWYEQQGAITEAIHHALAAHTFERAADLIEQAWPVMRNRQQETTALGWLNRLPDSLIQTRPVLSVTYALVMLNTGQQAAVEARLQDAERGLAQLGKQESNNERYRSLPASIANARAFCAQALGDIDGAISYAQQALALLPSEEDSERGVTAAFLSLAYWTKGELKDAHQSLSEGRIIFQKLGAIQIMVSATLGLAKIGIAQGWLQASAKTCEQTLQFVEQQSEPILRGTADLYLALSEIRYEQGDLVAANQLLSQGKALREQGSVSGANYLWWLVEAKLQAARGDFDAVLELLQEAARLRQRSPIPNVSPIEAIKVRWWLQQGRFTEALSWSQECGLSVNDQLSYLHEYEHLTLASVLIAQYRRDVQEEVLAQTIELLNRLLAAAEAQERTGSIIKILVFLALANEAQGEITDAISSLQRAINLAEPEGYVRIFAEQGSPMVNLLQEAMNQGITSTYSHQLEIASVTWDKRHQNALMTASTAVSQPLLDPLSERELDVLRLLNTELSGPDIARELVVALSTVRTHTKRIYSKLNVSNRRTAVKRAKELNLL